MSGAALFSALQPSNSCSRPVRLPAVTRHLALRFLHGVQVLWLTLAALGAATTNLPAQCVLGNCANGWGTFVWETGEVYTGQWINGRRTGLGVYDWPDGSFYIGYFENDLLHGRGIYISGNGGKDLVGLFSSGSFVQPMYFDSVGCIMGNCYNGAGVFIWENAEMYVGQWKNGRRSGFGRYDWADRSVYIGEFVNDMLEGLGEYTGADGKRMKGIFKANELISPLTDTLSEADSARLALWCNDISRLLEQYLAGFEGLKGEPIQGAYRLAASWKSTFAPSACREALIVDPLGNASNQFQCVLLQTAPLQSVMSLYYRLSDQISVCNFSCCSFTANELETEYGDYLRYATFWTPDADKPVTDERYRNLLITLEAETEPDETGYRLRLLITPSL